MSRNSKDGKRIITVSASTSFDVEDCADRLNGCLEDLSIQGVEIVLQVRKSHVRVVGGKNTTVVVVLGDSRGGWKHSGMENVCGHLEKSGYLVQAITSCFSFVPS